jgi:hypothetical protein
MVRTTKEQRAALHRKWDEAYNEQNPRHSGKVTMTYRDFRKTVQPCFDGSGCIMVHWCGMWLGIERDGYTHS